MELVNLTLWVFQKSAQKKVKIHGSLPKVVIISVLFPNDSKTWQVIA